MPENTSTEARRPSPAPDTVDEAGIRRLVETFYGRVMQDPALAPVFERAIGPFGTAAWGPHLDTMAAFWSSVVLRTGRYHGNPMGAHLRVDGIAPELFAHWLRLFDATAAELFPPAVAAVFSDRAHRIAESLKLGLFYRPGHPAAAG